MNLESIKERIASLSLDERHELMGYLINLREQESYSPLEAGNNASAWLTSAKGIVKLEEGETVDDILMARWNGR
ncbi:hypothetical protein WJU23_13760 [Prosthecobacter sp. SYSU 5D2]|uniref:hypothetical protein n=1 Tax=Prosthecobacter sp. SYSU 5D2 TaxID=3134134 RepID=UPI0031FF19C4